MKKIVVVLLIAFMAVLGTSQAQAWNLSIDQSGPIGGVNAGDTLFFDIIFNSDTGGNTLGTYSIDLLYDDVEMDWNLGNSSFSPPSPLNAQPFGPPFEIVSGRILGIASSLPFGASPAPVTGSVTLASLAFDVNAGINATWDGFLDLQFDSGAPTGVCLTVDGTCTPMVQANLIQGPDIAVAPEPISSTLFLVGGATLGFRRFRKKFKK